MAKSYDVSHEDLVNIVAGETNYSKKDIDETINAYEKSISTSVNQIIEKDEAFDEINVYSKVCAYKVTKDIDAEYGETASLTPLIPKDVFSAIQLNSKAIASSNLDNALNENTVKDNEEAKKKAKAS